MNIGDCYILRSEIHKIDVGLILIGQTKRDFLFTPIIFPENKFDYTESSVFESKLLTNKVMNGLSQGFFVGVFGVRENKKAPSFLTDYCNTNSAFINLNLDENKLSIDKVTYDTNDIIIGGGYSLPESKDLFDKFDIQSFSMEEDWNHTDLLLILKSK